jgi:hypothetical protein
MPEWKSRIQRSLKPRKFFPENREVIARTFNFFSAERKRALFVVQRSGFEDAIVRSSKKDRVSVMVLSHTENSTLSAVIFGVPLRSLTYTQRGDKRKELIDLLKRDSLGSLGSALIKQTFPKKENAEVIPVIEVKSLVVPRANKKLKANKSFVVARKIDVMKKLLERINFVYANYINYFGEVTVKLAVPKKESAYIQALQKIGFAATKEKQNLVFLLKTIKRELPETK